MTNPQKSPGEKSYFHNWLSVLSGIGAIISFSVILFLIVLDFIADDQNPYVTGITYVLLPGFFLLCLLLILIGAYRERKARHRRGFVRQFPYIDFNNPEHQKWALFSVGIITFVTLFSLFGTYKAYQFTESVTFCGKVCHQVMQPEYTAYHNSPHARVSCVQCHIGPGADWYVRSKMSGARQILAVLVNSYSRPIETPVKNLRPAQETCEQCHWPQQFFGAVEQDKRYFLSDEQNTQWQAKMLMFVGGGGRPFGESEGIHWHMNIKNKVHYIATDEKRQVIPWVKTVDQNGKETIYVDRESKFKPESPPSGELRRMDCIDCHNRPSHIYKSPAEAVNEALAAKNIDPSLPFIKKESVRALVANYESHKDAEKKIRLSIERFYREEYPDTFQSKHAEIDAAIKAVVKIYQNNFFPEMKVSWKQYPDNIGHMIFPGCFRCHDGKHESADGKIISNDCKACHSILVQGQPGATESAVEGLEFKHPNDEEAIWKEMSCTDCHTGGLD